MVGRNVNVEKGKQGFQPRAPKAESSKPLKIAVPEAPDPIQTEGDRIISEESARAQRTLSATREHITSQLVSGKRLSSSDYRNLMKHESRAAIWSEVEEIVASRGVTYTEAAARGRKMAMRKVLDSMPDQRSSNQLSNVMDDYQQSELLEFIRWTEDLDAYGTVG